MNVRCFFSLVLMVAVAQIAQAQTSETKPAPSQATKGTICLFTGLPPSDYHYTVVKRLKFGKGAYGSVNDILPRLVESARSVGANAVINYNGSQRFGFWPWRFVRPIVTGTAIKWSPPRDVDCASIGGHPTDGTLDAAPPR